MNTETQQPVIIAGMKNGEMVDWVKQRFNCQSDYALAERLQISRQALWRFRGGDGRSVACALLAAVIATLEQPATAETGQPVAE